VAKPAAPASTTPRKPVEAHAPRTPAARKPVVSGKAAAARPHFSRPAAHTRDRKPSQSSSSSRPAGQPVRAPPIAPGLLLLLVGAPSRLHPQTASATRLMPATVQITETAGRLLAGGFQRTLCQVCRTCLESAQRKPTQGLFQRRKTAGKPGATPAPAARRGRIPRPTLGQLTQAITGSLDCRSARAGSSKRFGFSARPKQGTKKRG